jgi:hypothetical protein
MIRFYFLFFYFIETANYLMIEICVCVFVCCFFVSIQISYRALCDYNTVGTCQFHTYHCFASITRWWLIDIVPYSFSLSLVLSPPSLLVICAQLHMGTANVEQIVSSLRILHASLLAS